MHLVIDFPQKLQKTNKQTKKNKNKKTSPETMPCCAMTCVTAKVDQDKNSWAEVKYLNFVALV